MIITRSPLRITLGGGGTDLPFYYRQFGGFCISAAIDKYVYITIHDPFAEELIIKYSRMERVSKIDEIQHPLIREALILTGHDGGGLEIASMSDIPAGTGLGSSGSFLTALLLGLHLRKKAIIPKQQLAEEACHIEIDQLREPIGKQDQYIAAFGGITCFEFCANGEVKVEPLQLSARTQANLEDNLILFYTGYTRSASEMLRDQMAKSSQADAFVMENLHFIKQVALETKAALERGDLRQFAALMQTQWEYKKRRSKSASNTAIDTWYELACNNGALGGKLVGAGGGGFLLFYAEDKTRLRNAMVDSGLREVRMRFDFQGSILVTQS